jgi:hypothetical protein
MSEIVDLYAVPPTISMSRWYARKTWHPDGFLSLKEFHRVVGVEMQAIKKMKAMD